MLQIEADADIARFINRLEKFDKEVSKELKAGMREGTNRVVAEAKSLLPKSAPLSGWGAGWIEQDREQGRNLTYDVNKAQRGIKAVAFRARRRGATVAFGFQAVQKDPAASIFEKAGSDNPAGNPLARPGSRTFNRNIIRLHGSNPYPRIMYPAYYAGIKEAREIIDAALQRARKRVGL